MSEAVKFYADDSEGVRFEYRFVCSRIERRRFPSAFWTFVHDGEWARMTPDELELIAGLIRRGSEGAHAARVREAERGEKEGRRGRDE